jgi:hypothetical protein
MPGLNDCHCRRKASRWQGVAADHNDGSVLGYVVAHPAHNDVADTAPAAHMARRSGAGRSSAVKRTESVICAPGRC